MAIRNYEVQVVAEEQVTEFAEIDFKAINGVKAALVAGGSGAATGAVAFGAVGAFASASTGTAIATLHGVAATNATLAFLGGGSLATGGLGMAGGVAVLGGLVAVPVLVVGGIYANSKANEVLNSAQQDADKVNQFIRESDKAIAILVDIRTKSFKLKNVLLEFDQRLVLMVEALKALIDEHTYGGVLKRFYYAVKGFILKGMRRLGITPPMWLESEARLSVSALKPEEQERAMLVVQSALVIKAILDTGVVNKEGLVPASVGDTLDLSEKFLARFSAGAPIR